jgi:hypothetical protein
MSYLVERGSLSGRKLCSPSVESDELGISRATRYSIEWALQALFCSKLNHLNIEVRRRSVRFNYIHVQHSELWPLLQSNCFIAERLNGIRNVHVLHAPRSLRSFTRDLFALVFTFATSGTIQVPVVPWPSLFRMESHIFVDAALLLE